MKTYQRLQRFRKQNTIKQNFKGREKERKIETEILYWFLSQTESTSSPLALPREFTIIKQDYNCSSTQARDFQCSSNTYKRLPLLKHTSKRLQTTYKKNRVYEH